MEKRKEYSRHEIELSIRWRVPTGKWHSGTLKDLGRGGLCLFANSGNLKNHDQVEMHFNLEFPAHTLTTAVYDHFPMPLNIRLKQDLIVAGKVCWQKKVDNRISYGLTFTDRDDPAWHLLCDFLHEQQLS